jgi:NAD(P)-dependent dehydrogenase (short-subunit alcohol dehydrogenase family)
VEFDRRHKDRGVRATAVHPGAIQTELGRHMTPEALAELRARIKTATRSTNAYKTVPQGAATSVWSGAVAPAEAVGARYCEDCHVAEINDDPNVSGGVRSYALDPDNAKALWAKSEEMVGERF